MMGKIIENYSLQELLGEGVYGKVYKAIHTKTKQQVAIKVVRSEKFKEIPKLEEFTVNEINTLSNMEPNQHIVKYIDMLKTVNNFYFVYEYCNGGTLDKILQNYKNTPQKVMPEKKALIYFRQIVDAFKTLTKNNIMHRDLKPDNILLHNGIIKLADFGFCKSLNSPTQMAQTMLGSPIYMAPEVLKGQIYTMKADIWSLGVVLYEMIAGQCPFQSNSIAKLIQILDNTQLNFPPNINPVLQKLLKRMLVKDHSKRIDWSELFQYKITDSGDIIQPKTMKNLTTSFGGFSYNSILNSIQSQSQNNLISTSSNSKTENIMANKNNSFQNGFSPTAYQSSMMRRRSPIKDSTEESKNYFSKKANNIETSSNSSTANSKSNIDINNQKYDQLIKNHKKIIFVVQLAIDVIRKNTKDNSTVCFLIMKTVEKDLNQLTESLRKQVDIGSFNTSINSSTSTNQFLNFRNIAEKEVQNLQIFMKSLRQDIIKNIQPQRFQNLASERNRYLKSYIENLKLQSDLDQTNFIHASQVLDYFQQSILLKKDTYQRLTREQLYKIISTKISKL